MSRRFPPQAAQQVAAGSKVEQQGDEIGSFGDHALDAVSIVGTKLADS